MSLSPTKVVLGERYQHRGMAYETGAVNAWQTCILPLGVALVDNLGNPVTNPNTQLQVSAATTKIIDHSGIGNIMMLRCAYDPTLTTISSPYVRVFGRTGTDFWMLLRVLGGSQGYALTCDPATDATDGTYKYTSTDILSTAWPVLGCKEIIVTIESALSGSVGTPATAFIQCKFIYSPFP